MMARTVLLIATIVAVVVISARAHEPQRIDPVQQRICFPPGTVGVEDFDNCPDGYYGEKVDV